MVGGEPGGPEGGGDMPEPGAPECQRVDQRLGKDDLIAGGERLDVPHAAVRAGQIQVLRGPRPQVVADLPAVDLSDRAVLAKHGDDQRPGEMLMPGGPEDAQLLQPAPDIGTIPAALV